MPTEDGPNIDKDAQIFELQMKLQHANRVIEAYSDALLLLTPHLQENVDFKPTHL
jgi:hypothetical protein